ncbi:MAG: Gfo/Idh/MocA family oxidoreductase, partial [Myxococcota bacterium]
TAGPRLAELAKACRKASRCFMPAHPWRFRPSVRAVRDALDAGKLGKPGLLRIHRWDRSAGAEGVSAQLIPEIDLANWFFASPPREIYALARDDYLQVHLGFANGGMALIDHAALPTDTGYYSLSLIGSTGAAYADDHRDLQLLLAGDTPSALGKVEGILPVIGQLDEFASAIRAARQPSVTMEATVAALDVLDAVTSAARERRVSRSSTSAGGSYELDG